MTKYYSLFVENKHWFRSMSRWLRSKSMWAEPSGSVRSSEREQSGERVILPLRLHALFAA